MMVMYPRCGLVRAVNSVSKHSVGFAVVEPGDAALPCLDLHQHVRQIPVRRRSAHQRHMRRALKNLLAFLLRHTAQHAKLLALRLQLLVIRQAVKDFLLGFIADGAGVVENQPSLVHRRNLAIPLRNERANDLFRVMHIHLTAKGLEVEGLLRIPTHEVSIARGGGGLSCAILGENGRNPCHSEGVSVPRNPLFEAVAKFKGPGSRPGLA